VNGDLVSLAPPDSGISEITSCRPIRLARILVVGLVGHLVEKNLSAVSIADRPDRLVDESLAALSIKRVQKDFD
jgi:hypothetical protein